MDGVKYYANEPTLLGKAFLRLERDFDNHVNYCRDEHRAQEFLDASDEAFNYFAVSFLINGEGTGHSINQLEMALPVFSNFLSIQTRLVYMNKHATFSTVYL